MQHEDVANCLVSSGYIPAAVVKSCGFALDIGHASTLPASLLRCCFKIAWRDKYGLQSWAHGCLVTKACVCYEGLGVGQCMGRVGWHGVMGGSDVGWLWERFSVAAIAQLGER